MKKLSNKTFKSILESYFSKEYDTIHLPKEQMIIFEEGTEREQLLNELNKDTQLSAYFKLQEEDEELRKYYYSEIPLHYVFSNGKWHKRQRSQDKVITRLYSVSPAEKERYHLRIVLLNVKGARSFEELRTYNGKLYNTFEEAAYARGFFINDNEWINVLDEAVSNQSPSNIRQLFSYICIFNRPHKPLELYNKFFDDMTEDIEENKEE